MTKKIIALIVAATVVTGTGAFGTHAILTQDNTVKDNINITMGTLDVASYWTGNWAATSSVTEVNNTGAGLSYSNVKPGDTFERTIAIANRGTLQADVVASIVNNYSDDFDVEIVNVAYNTYGPKAQMNQDNTEVAKRFTTRDGSGNHYMNVTLKVTVKDSASASNVGKALKADSADFLNVTATQLTVDEQ